MKIIYSISILLFLISMNACQDKHLPNLDKWILIHETFTESLYRKDEIGNGILFRLEKIVSRNGYPEAGRIKLDIAKEVIAKTRQMMDKLESLKRRLVEEEGRGYNQENGQINRPNKVIGTHSLEELPVLLDQYVSYLNEEYKDLIGKKIEKLTKTKTDKDFLEENFSGEPLIIVLALITEKQLQTLQYEQLVLESLLRDYAYSSERFKPDYMVYAKADADAISEGQNYQANIFYQPYYHDLGIKMTCNGEEIPIENSIGKIQFIADKLGKQTYEVGITLKMKGGDTTLTRTISYFVLR